MSYRDQKSSTSRVPLELATIAPTSGSMFPIRDHNPSNGLPFVTWTLIAINVLVFLSYVDLFAEPRALNTFFLTYGMVPAAVTSGGHELTVFTSMFLHGGFLHLLGNMLFLYIFGDNLEDVFGHVGFLAFYLISGIGAGLAHVYVDPGSTIPTVGASGAIAGVMGGYLLLFPRARVDILFIFIIIVRIIPVPAWVMLGLWFALQLTNGVAADPSGGGVAYWAHAGGFLIGLVLTVPFWLARGGPRYWRRTEGHPPFAPTRYRVVRTDVPRSGRRQRTYRGPWSRG